MDFDFLPETGHFDHQYDEELFDTQKDEKVNQSSPVDDLEEGEIRNILDFAEPSKSELEEILLGNDEEDDFNSEDPFAGLADHSEYEYQTGAESDAAIPSEAESVSPENAYQSDYQSDYQTGADTDYQSDASVAVRGEKTGNDSDDLFSGSYSSSSDSDVAVIPEYHQVSILPPFEAEKQVEEEQKAMDIVEQKNEIISAPNVKKSARKIVNGIMYIGSGSDTFSSEASIADDPMTESSGDDIVFSSQEPKVAKVTETKVTKKTIGEIEAAQDDQDDDLDYYLDEPEKNKKEDLKEEEKSSKSPKAAEKPKENNTNNKHKKSKNEKKNKKSKKVKTDKKKKSQKNKDKSTERKKEKKSSKEPKTKKNVTDWTVCDDEKTKEGDLTTLMMKSKMRKSVVKETFNNKKRKYQIEGINWMLGNEGWNRFELKQGGVLADEQGLGKTFQTISLVLASRRLEQEQFKIQKDAWIKLFKEADKKKKGRLTPKSIKDTLRHSNQLVIFEADMAEALKILNDKDNDEKVDYVKFTEQVFANRLKPTLVIVPSSSIARDTWMHEIKKFTHLKDDDVWLYHGATRFSKKNQELLKKRTFVLTTYQTVAAEAPSYVFVPESQEDNDTSNKEKKAIRGKRAKFAASAKKKEEKGKRRSIIFEQTWERVVVDEAQRLNDRNGKESIAVKAIKKEISWGLTGTPWNRDVKQWAGIWEFIFGRDSKYAKPAFWVKLLSVTDEEELRENTRKLEAFRAKYMLRREAGDIPHKLQKIFCTLSETEYDVYKMLKEGASDALKQYQRNLRLKMADESRKNSNTVRTQLLHMCEACDDIILVAGGRQVTMQLSDLVSDSAKNQKNKEKCCMCLKRFGKKGSRKGKDDEVDEDEENLEESSGALLDIKLTCGHYICGSCDSQPSPSGCQFCQMLDKYKETEPSSKVAEILKSLKTIFSTKATKRDKVIICSQYTAFLDVLEAQIKKHVPVFNTEEGGKYKLCRFDGDLKTDGAKQKVLNQFKKSKSTKIMLMSIKCGATGLNLQHANHFFDCEPNFNPHLVAQARRRVHRYGQEKMVYIYEYITKLPEEGAQASKSIESGVLEVQEDKKHDANILTGKLTNESISERGAMGKFISIISKYILENEEEEKAKIQQKRKRAEEREQRRAEKEQAKMEKKLQREKKKLEKALEKETKKREKAAKKQRIDERAPSLNVYNGNIDPVDLVTDSSDDDKYFQD